MKTFLLAVFAFVFPGFSQAQEVDSLFNGIVVEPSLRREYNRLPEDTVMLSQDPPGEFFTVAVKDSIWLMRPGKKTGSFVGWFVPVETWDGDFYRQCQWEVLNQGGRTFWVVTSCYAFSHTRYEEQTGDKWFAKAYFLAGHEPVLWLDIALQIENWYATVYDSLPEYYGYTRRVEFEKKTLKTVTAFWNKYSSDREWMPEMIESEYVRKGGNWQLISEYSSRKGMVTHAEALLLLPEKERNYCQWWFEYDTW